MPGHRGGAMPLGVKTIGRRTPGRYARWKGSLGTLKSWLVQAAGVGRTPLGVRGLLRPMHRPPYPTRRGLVTAWQETKKLLQDEIWMDNVREDLEITIKNYQDW